MSFRPTSKRAAPPARSDFKAGPKAKPGAVAKANRADAKSDRAIAKKYGVKTKG